MKPLSIVLADSSGGWWRVGVNPPKPPGSLRIVALGHLRPSDDRLAARRLKLRRSRLSSSNRNLLRWGGAKLAPDTCHCSRELTFYSDGLVVLPCNCRCACRGKASSVKCEHALHAFSLLGANTVGSPALLAFTRSQLGTATAHDPSLASSNRSDASSGTL